MDQKINLKYALPSMITSGNLLCGMLAIIFAGWGDLTLAAMFIGVAAILDFFDGFAARLLNASSEFGKQLDSLADVITFGVAPAILFYNMGHNLDDVWYNYTSILIALFAALRLAKFNIDDSQSTEFTGVPTPAMAILIASLPFILEYDTLNIGPWIESEWFIMLFPLVASYLMIANFRLFSLKVKSFKWEENKLVFAFLILSIGLLALFKYTGIAFIIILYILLSLIRNFAPDKS